MPSELTNHNCPDCDRDFDSLKAIRVHFRQSHEGEYDAELHRECAVCGDEFTTYPSQDHKCCSKECGYKHREVPSEEDHVLYDPEAHLECEQCGSDFVRRTDRTESQDRFCSPDCWSAWCKDHPERRDFEGYGAGFKKLRRKVRNRDTVCQICGHDGTEYRLECHHIRKVATFENPSDSHTMDNAVLLCASCHRHADAGRVEELLSRADSKAVTQFVPNQPSIEETQ